MSERIFRCCKNKPSFSVIYSVAGEQKHYHVCSDCIHLECFSKYIIEKTPIRTQTKKIFQNDENAECDEREDDGEKICENSDENAHFISEAMK